MARRGAVGMLGLLCAAFVGVSGALADVDTVRAQVVDSAYRGLYMSPFIGGYDPDAWWVCYVRGDKGFNNEPIAWYPPECSVPAWESVDDGLGGTIQRSAYFERNTQAMDDQKEYDIVYQYIVPPQSMKQFEYQCDYTGYDTDLDTGSTENNIYTGWSTAAQKWTFTNWTGDASFNKTPGSFVATVWVNNSSDRWDSVVDNIGTWDYSTATSAPGDYKHRRSFDALAHSGNQFATSHLKCTITDYELFAGEVWVPIIPTPTPSYPMVTPWAPITWTRPVSQTIITAPLEVVPGSTDCVTVIPDWFESGVTLGGITLSDWSFPGVEVCLANHAVGLTVMGWDLGAMAVTLATLGMAGALYVVLQRGQ